MDDFEPSTTRRVALRKESVDRNIPSKGTLRNTHVALRKESVDRNARQFSICGLPTVVALRKESVDRNTSLNAPLLQIPCCRSPQGERG